MHQCKQNSLVSESLLVAMPSKVAAESVLRGGTSVVEQVVSSLSFKSAAAGNAGDILSVSVRRADLQQLASCRACISAWLPHRLQLLPSDGYVSSPCTAYLHSPPCTHPLALTPLHSPLTLDPLHSDLGAHPLALTPFALLTCALHAGR